MIPSFCPPGMTAPFHTLVFRRFIKSVKLCTGAPLVNLISSGTTTKIPAAKIMIIHGTQTDENLATASNPFAATKVTMMPSTMTTRINLISVGYHWVCSLIPKISLTAEADTVSMDAAMAMDASPQTKL